MMLPAAAAAAATKLLPIARLLYACVSCLCLPYLLYPFSCIVVVVLLLLRVLRESERQRKEGREKLAVLQLWGSQC